jgi:type 1 glutamine amidotransferase
MLKVLMIGKQEPERYHDPLARYNDFKQPMSSKGIQVDYIDDYSKITDAGLKPYDVILVYTMHYDFAKGAEFGAIRRFVESGKGLVGTHTATVIWGNSEWTKLIGALFEQHNYGDPILLEITNPNHEALKGVPTSIPAFEESYFFDKNSNATDRVILQRRKEMVGARADEWTWVRDQGKGRVYYTAAGHDAAWRTKEFHKQLEVALKWAAGGAQATQIMISRAICPFRLGNPQGSICLGCRRIALG